MAECAYEYCHEPTFRDSPFCFEHFVQEETAKWDDQDAERELCLEGVGLVFSPALDDSWWGYDLKELA